jgi:hypothetical protein
MTNFMAGFIRISKTPYEYSINIGGTPLAFLCSYLESAVERSNQLKADGEFCESLRMAPSLDFLDLTANSEGTAMELVRILEGIADPTDPLWPYSKDQGRFPDVWLKRLVEEERSVEAEYERWDQLYRSSAQRVADAIRHRMARASSAPY